MAQFEILVKVGNQRADGRGYQDGDFVCYYPLGWKWTEREHKSFAIIRLDIDEEILKQYMSHPFTNAEAEADIKKRYKPRLGYIDLDALSSVFDEKTISDIRDKDKSVPVLQSLILTIDIVKNYRDNPRT